MQERRGKRWTRRSLGMVIAVECLISFTILSMYLSRWQGLILQSPELLTFKDMNSFVRFDFRKSAKSAQEARRRLLMDSHNGFYNSSNGIRAALLHRPSDCSPASSGPGGNSSTSLSKEAQRVQHLQCALQRSSSRVGYLVNRKYRDRQAIAYGLPTKDVTEVEDISDVEGQGGFVRELLDSPEWEDSYESDVWSQPGEYIMSLEVGTPPRRLQGILDTGSDLTWFQCRRCQRCYAQSNPIYEPNDSSTYVELDCEDDRCEDISTSFCNVFSDSCDYMYTYGDDSYTYGSLSSDTFWLRTVRDRENREEIPEIEFGCSHSSRGTFTHTRADGVVALGRGPLSLASQLGDHLNSDRFGYCLVSRRHPPTVTSPVYFGDAAILVGPGAGYTPLLANERHRAYYFVNMTGISVGGRLLDIPPEIFAINSAWRGGTIIDSGTTVTNMRSEAYDALIDAFNASVRYPFTLSDSRFDLCYDVGDASEVRFPGLVFHLDGVDMDLPLENYMLEAEDRTMCLGIDRSSDSLTVIGNVQQQNFRVLYDRQNERIGLQPAICTEE